ncbi:MAG: M48 family metalloprotease [Novosphingobium sp.]
MPLPLPGGTGANGFELPNLLPQPGPVPVTSPAHEAMLKEYGGAFDGPQNALVQSAITRISLAAGTFAPRGGYRATLLNSPVLNAFAYPDGNAYITRQLLALTNTEEDLIGIMGHEAGHVIFRHGNMDAALRTPQKAGAAVLGTFLPEIGNMAKVSGDLVLGVLDRAQEHQCDISGVKFLSKLGMDPMGMYRGIRALDLHEKLDNAEFGARSEGAMDYWLRSHPVNAERLSLITTAAQTFTGPPTSPAARAAYIRALDGMLFDDGPNDGILDGRVFRHPVIGLALTIPDAWTMRNGQKVVFTSKTGGILVMAMHAGSGTAEQLFARSWSDEFKAGKGQPAPIIAESGGIIRATGSTRTGTAAEPVAVTLAVYRWTSQSYIRLIAIDKGLKAEPQIAAILASVQRLSPEAAASVRVRRVKVVDIRPGDTVAGLSEKMAYDNLREQRFRALNGLGPADRLPASGPVKLVVWAPR